MAGFRIQTGVRSANAARERFQNAVVNVQERQWLSVMRAALLAEREIKKNIRSQGVLAGKPFKPLATTTRLLRKGTKPLIDSGSLLGSVTTTLDKPRLAAFVGVHRSARRGGGDNFNVAVAHEFGTPPFVIPVTDAVRRLFWYLHFASNGKIKPLGPNKTEIMHPGVPARPFLRPTIEKIRPELQSVIARAFVSGGGPI